MNQPIASTIQAMIDRLDAQAGPFSEAMKQVLARFVEKAKVRDAR